MHKVSQFSYFSPPINKKKPIPIDTWTVSRTYQEIQSDSLKEITAKIRECKTSEERNKIKQSKLPYVTFAGTFKYRSNDNLNERSGLIVMDIDHLGAKVQETKAAILSEIQPVLMFIGPSGSGLKVVCSIDPQAEHSAYYIALKVFFHQHFSLTIDKGGDISRACFLCYDPDVFLSDDPTIFDQSFIDSMGTDDFEEVYRRGKIWINKQLSFIDGNRHTYITNLAGFLNRAGMNQPRAETKLFEFVQPGFGKEEISSIVKAIYRKTELFGISPMNITAGRDSYTTFPLKLLWVPRDQFCDRINEILSDSYQHSTGDIPTSVKTSYLIDVINDRLDPELLLLLAAVKSIIGYKNYARTTRAFIFKRMYGGNPWRKLTRYFFEKLRDIAVEKNMLVMITTFPGFYVSIRHTVDELEKEICEYLKKRNEKKQKSKDAAKRISEFRSKLSAT
jgi:hypothetical protein